MVIRSTHTMQREVAYTLLSIGIIPPSYIAGILPKRFNNHNLHAMYEARLAIQAKQPKVYDFMQFWIELAKLQVVGTDGELITISRLANMPEKEQLENPTKREAIKESNHELFRPLLLNFRFYKNLHLVRPSGAIDLNKIVNGYAFETSFYFSSEDTKHLCRKFIRMFQLALKRYNYDWEDRRVELGSSKDMVIFEAVGFDTR